MKYRNLILTGIIASSMVIQTQAAVYGTLKQDMYFNVADSTVDKVAGDGVSIVDQDENNYLIRVNEETNEYVSKHFVKIEGIITRTIEEDARIRTDASQDAEVVTTLPKAELVMVLEKEDNYYKVKINDIVGYIEKAAVDTSNLASLTKQERQDDTRMDVVNYAKSHLGTRYIYGGNDLNRGVDCSGFVQQVMKHAGIQMSRSSSSQYANNGSFVEESELLPGDLVYYGNGSHVNHAAMYIGDNQIIHANDESTGVIISQLHYGKPIIGMKRVIN